MEKDERTMVKTLTFHPTQTIGGVYNHRVPTLGRILNLKLSRTIIYLGSHTIWSEPSQNSLLDKEKDPHSPGKQQFQLYLE